MVFEQFLIKSRFIVDTVLTRRRLQSYPINHRVLTFMPAKGLNLDWRHLCPDTIEEDFCS